MDNKPIIALDFANEQEVSQFLQSFPNIKLNLKVGMELFYQEGPSMVHTLKEAGHDVFLDLKLHDIPTTVKKAMTGIARLGVDMITMHAAGGKAMMEEAKEGLEIGTPPNGQRPLLLAVTQLTSTSEEMLKKEQCSQNTMEQSVLHYAELAYAAHAEGVVCSAHEARVIRDRLGQDFLRVSPGIRMGTDHKNDQKRVATPALAREIGVSHIVIGRTVTQALNPVNMYLEVLHQWKGEIRE